MDVDTTPGERDGALGIWMGRTPSIASRRVARRTHWLTMPVYAPQVGCFSLSVERRPFDARGLVGHLEDVVVDDTKRGSGLGRALIRAAAELAAQLGCHRLSLNVRRA